MKGGRAAFLQEVDQVRLGFVPDMFVTYHPLNLNRALPISPKASFAVTDGKYSRIVKHCSHLAIHENYSLIPMGSMCCVPPNHHPHTLAYSAGPRCSCCFWFPAKKVLCNPSQVGFSKWCMGKYFLPWNYFTTLAGLHGVEPGVALGAVGTLCQLPFLCFLSFLCTVGTRGAANWLVIYAGIPFLVLRWTTLSIVVDLKGPHLEALYTASASTAICLSKHLKI